MVNSPMNMRLKEIFISNYRKYHWITHLEMKDYKPEKGDCVECHTHSWEYKNTHLGGDINPQNLLLATHLNSHHLWRCPTTAALETSPPSPSRTTCATQAPPMAPPSPATWSTGLTSALPAPAIWVPLSTVRRPAVSPSGPRLWCPVPVRRPATAWGPPRSPVPARRLALGLWASGPAAAAPWALDPEAATQWAVDPVASDTWVMESVASLPWAVDLDSAGQPSLPPGVATLPVTGQPVDLASSDQLVKSSDVFSNVSNLWTELLSSSWSSGRLTAHHIFSSHKILIKNGLLCILNDQFYWLIYWTH